MTRRPAPPQDLTDKTLQSFLRQGWISTRMGILHDNASGYLISVAVPILSEGATDSVSALVSAATRLCGFAFVVKVWFSWGHSRSRFGRGPAHGLAQVAVLIGGLDRAWRDEEFAADLTSRDPTSIAARWARTRHAAGLIRAAVVMRADDLFHALRAAVSHARRRSNTNRH